MLESLVRTGAGVAIEVLLQLELGIEPSLLRSEIHLLLHPLASFSERGEARICRKVRNTCQ